MNKILFALLFSVVAAFAAVPADSAVAAPADSTAEMSAPQETCSEFKSELAHRDSLMAIADSSCSVEKDSLRATLNSEKAKGENWEKSYETMKKSNEACAKALSVSIGVSEKSKEKRDEERREAAMMSGSAFLGGLGLGMLLFWLIFD
jgi:hypothetical protein